MGTPVLSGEGEMRSIRWSRGGLMLSASSQLQHLRKSAPFNKERRAPSSASDAMPAINLAWDPLGWRHMKKRTLLPRCGEHTLTAYAGKPALVARGGGPGARAPDCQSCFRGERCCVPAANAVPAMAAAALQKLCCKRSWERRARAILVASGTTWPARQPSTLH